MTRARLILIPLGALLATMTGCGGSSDPLDRKAFVLLDATGIDALEGAPIRLEFSDGSVGVTGGCNLIGGAYELEGDTLVVQNMIQTEMACEQSRMDQDSAIIEFLQARPKVDGEGSTLVLTAGGRVTTWDTAPPTKEK